MRRRPAWSVFAIAYVLSVQPLLLAQALSPAFHPETQNGKVCAALPAERPSGPEVRIAELNFEGDLRIPAAEQDRIAASLRQRVYWGERDEIAEEVLARVRTAWQDRGYFQVQVGGGATVLTSGPAAERITVHAQVDEGQQYRLGSIRFKNNRAIGNTKALRNLFPLEDGDVFDRAKIAEGLEALRSAYGQYGYLNFTSIPNTEIHEDDLTISLEVDVDEGKQFFISSIDSIGAGDDVSEASPLKPGDVYNQSLVKLLFRNHARFPVTDGSEDAHIHLQFNEKAGTVAVTLDFRECPV
jgi:outer membrane protein assembly factor BamA